MGRTGRVERGSCGDGVRERARERGRERVKVIRGGSGGSGGGGCARVGRREADTRLVEKSDECSRHRRRAGTRSSAKNMRVRRGGLCGVGEASQLLFVSLL
jgi:hypothetical protein